MAKIFLITLLAVLAVPVAGFAIWKGLHYVPGVSRVLSDVAEIDDYYAGAEKGASRIGGLIAQSYEISRAMASAQGDNEKMLEGALGVLGRRANARELAAFTDPAAFTPERRLVATRVVTPEEFLTEGERLPEADWIELFLNTRVLLWAEQVCDQARGPLAADCRVRDFEVNQAKWCSTPERATFLFRDEAGGKGREARTEEERALVKTLSERVTVLNGGDAHRAARRLVVLAPAAQKEETVPQDKDGFPVLDPQAEKPAKPEKVCAEVWMAEIDLDFTPATAPGTLPAPDTAPKVTTEARRLSEALAVTKAPMPADRVPARADYDARLLEALAAADAACAAPRAAHGNCMVTYLSVGWDGASRAAIGWAEATRAAPAPVPPSQ